jgi:hypothetical protein
MICTECGAPKAQLLLSFYCPNGCDESVDLDGPQDWETEGEDAHPYRSAEYVDRDPKPIVGTAPGTTTLQLPDGTKIELHDWVATTLYSTCVIEPTAQIDAIRLFSNGLGQQVIGSFQNKFNTRAHTNVPRGGYCGLPKGWQFYVHGVYAETNYERNSFIEDWLFTSNASVIYRNKTYLDTPLTALMNPTTMMDPLEEPLHNEFSIEPYTTKFARTKDIGVNLVLPILLRENLEYEVNVASSCRRIQERLANHIRAQQGRELYLRVHLDGLLCKPVY